MLSSLKNLAVAVDGLDDRRVASITETSAALTVAGLSAIDANALVPLLQELGWFFEFVDGAGEVAGLTLTESYQPFVLTLF